MVVDWFRNLIDGVIDTLQGIQENVERDARERALWTQSGNVPEDGFDPDPIIEQFLGGLYDGVEDDIIEEFIREGTLTPENIEEALNRAEGSALEDALAVQAAILGIEVAGVGQIETHEELSSQILSVLILQDVLGRRLGMTMSKGVDPALEADVAKQTRSEFVDLQDAVEFALRTKPSDEGYLTLSGASEEAQEAVGSVDQESPNNLLEEWGIRDDNLRILERVALNDMEFEELLETPAELGLVVPDEVLQAELDRAGYAEDTKEFLSRVNDRLPQSVRVYQELVRTEDLVTQLDTLAEDEELTPEEAAALFPDDTELDKDELRERFRLLQEPPSGPPTRSLVEDSGTLGFTSLRTLEERLERLEYNTDRYDDAVNVTLYGEIDGNLQEAFALGLIDQATYGEVMDRLGLDSDAQAALMSGQSLGDVVSRRLEEQADPASLPVSSISGIGESRAAGLRAADIETVADLAQADPQTVAQAAQVESTTAQGFIDQASQRTS